jgi:adenine-specific DNA-methyltransferase
VDDQDDVDDPSLAKPPFPEDESDLWELRHARRRGGESSYRHQRPNQFYPLWVDPNKKRIVRAGETLPMPQKPKLEANEGLVPVWPIDAEGHDRCWRVVPIKMQSLVEQGRVVLGRYNAERKTWTVNIWVKKAVSKRLNTVWWETKHDAGTHGTSLLHKLLGKRDAFPFPKSIYSVRDAIAAVVRNNRNALVLDFFAGSGTTLQSVAMLNVLDDGSRQCILVTNNEVSAPKSKQLREKGKLPETEEWEKEGICRAVTLPRCKAAITGKRHDGKSVSGEWTTGRMLQELTARTVRALPFTTQQQLTDPRARKALASALGIVQGNLEPAEAWYIADGETRDHIPAQAVLLNPLKFDGFAAALKRTGQHIRTISIAIGEGPLFTKMRAQLTSTLGPIETLREETRPMSEGLTVNLDYFRLELIDPDAVEMGDKFSDLLPLLWMMAGAKGRLPRAKGSEDYLIFEECSFAVLLREKAFRKFNSAIKQIPPHGWVFLITDARDAFIDMSEQLPPQIPTRHRVHLYRSYLDNFRINVAENSI